MIVIDTPEKAAGLPTWKVYYGVDWGFDGEIVLAIGIRIVEEPNLPPGCWGLVLNGRWMQKP